MLDRLLVVGLNGSGKSHFAAALAAMRPDVPAVSYDAIKLASNWDLRPRADVERELLQIIQSDRWILEGGTTLLDRAIGRADAVVWLDPPELRRALRLLIRPWKSFGRTRPELPMGNVEWPWRQYPFAIRSLWRRKLVCAAIEERMARAQKPWWRIRTEAERRSFVDEWRRRPG